MTHPWWWNVLNGSIVVCLILSARDRASLARKLRRTEQDLLKARSETNRWWRAYVYTTQEGAEWLRRERTDKGRP